VEQQAWLRLRTEVQPDGKLVVGVADDLGEEVRRLRAPGLAFGWSEFSLPPSNRWPSGPLSIRYPVALPGMLAGCAERLGDGRVPVFAAAPPALFSGVDVAERLLRAIPSIAGTPAGPASVSPASLGEDRWVVLQDRATPRPATPFALPLRVAAVGQRGAEALARLGGPWITPDQDLQPYIADIGWLEEPRDVLPRLAERDIDVLIVDAFGASDLGSRLRRRARRPGTLRLVIVLGAGDGGALDAGDIRIPAARSVLTVKGPPGDGQLQAVRDFLLALSHDRPLHEALVSVRSQQYRADLSASPESLHDLRLASARAALERDLAELSGSVGPGTTQQLNEQVTRDLPATEQDTGRELVTGVSQARQVAAQVSFTRESLGLYPLARACRHLVSARGALHRLRAPALTLTSRDITTEPPFRVVNMALRHRGDAVAPGAASGYLDERRTLAAAGPYDLDVQIGAPWLNSLVADDPKTAQLHLPDDSRGHDVEVALFSDAVTVLGDRTRTLRVPTSGPSDLVTFPLVMPDAAGPAWVRLSVYHRENLLQTFRLDMLVTAAEEVRPEPVLVAHLQHSATRDWTNLDQLGARAVSITLNADSSGGHRIFVKRLDVTMTLPVDASGHRHLMDEVRKVLTDAVDQKEPTDEIVWQLARKGQELHGWIFNGSDDAGGEALRSLRGWADEAVQVIRADPKQAVPWSLVYDWSLPVALHGAPTPPVCFGRTGDGRPCGHGPDDGGVCVLGFWGIRHQLEELLGDPTRDCIPPEVAVGNPGALVALGVQDGATGTLSARLSPIVAPGAVRTLSAQESLLDSLFRADRPGIVLVLGHNETRTLFGEPEGSRISLLTSEAWLQWKAITTQGTKNGKWRPPHSVVFLLSCGSAASDVTELNGFLSALRGVKAGAIVGTECDVYSDQALDFTLHLLGAMTGRTGQPGVPPLTFTSAVRFARQHLVIGKEDPRGFAFSAFGPAGLSLVRT
jgi:hypothetical protein